MVSRALVPPRLPAAPLDFPPRRQRLIREGVPEPLHPVRLREVLWILEQALAPLDAELIRPFVVQIRKRRHHERPLRPSRVGDRKERDSRRCCAGGGEETVGIRIQILV